MKALIIDAHWDGYSVDQVYETITVSDLIYRLKDFDEDIPVYISYDNGYSGNKSGVDFGFGNKSDNNGTSSGPSVNNIDDIKSEYVKKLDEVKLNTLGIDEIIEKDNKIEEIKKQFNEIFKI